LAKENKLKNQEIENLKRNIKFTKYSELEVEKKAFADETIRLRKVIE
jgi:hypothetical protein